MYAWVVYGGAAAPEAQIVSESVAITAGVSTLVSLIAYFWTPKTHTKAAAFIVYVLLTATVAWLVHDTGGLVSPFIVLWMLVALFSGLLGARGLILTLLLLLGYTAWQFVDGLFSASDVPTFLLTGILPIVMSVIVWKNHDDERRTSLNIPQTSELNKVTNQSEIVINAIGDGVLAIDGQGIVRLINPAAQVIIGWDKHDAVKLNYRSVLQLTKSDGQELPIGADPIAQAMNTNQEHRVSDIGVLTSSGKKILISTTVSPIGDSGSGVIVTFRDVTKEKAEERQQAEFISTASHEMRTPVASIEGYLGLVLNPATATIDDKARVYITKAHESVQHLGRLFQDLLDITKAEDGRLTNNPDLIDVVEFVRIIVDGFRQKASEKGLQITYEPDAIEKKTRERQLNPVFYINVDRDHLREITGNLIENAIKYTPQGSISIDVSGDDDMVQISVEDSGIGIPAEDIPHLFQKFYRVDNTDTREIGGTGLGLYLCRRLIESMNGRIWVESTYKRGSTFFVSVPRLSRADATQLLAEQPQQPVSFIKPRQVADQPALSAMPPAQEFSVPAGSVTIQAPEIAMPQPQPYMQQISQEIQPRDNRPATSHEAVNVSLTTIEQNPRQFSYYGNRPQPRPPERQSPDGNRSAYKT